MKIGVIFNLSGIIYYIQVVPRDSPQIMADTTETGTFDQLSRIRIGFCWLVLEIMCLQMGFSTVVLKF